MSEMTISAAAQAASLSVKTVRYYADIGLVDASGRKASGYRTYDERAVRKLVFVRRARDFGFSVDQCRELLSLYGKQDRSSAEVKRIATQRLNEIAEKRRELELLESELSMLVQSCRGDSRPDCPIIDYLG
jgi:Cu(I)-responsive transcriptional regulator